METVLKKIMRNNLIAAVVAVGVSLIFLSSAVTRGILAGAALMAADLWLIRFLAGRLLASNARRAWPAVAVLLLKFGAFLGAAWALMKFVPMNLVAFGVGVAVVVFTTAMTASLQRGTPADA